MFPLQLSKLLPKTTLAVGLALVTVEQQEKFVFFCPHNQAFGQVPREVLYSLTAPTQASLKAREQTLLYHLVRLGIEDESLDTTDIGDVVKSSSANSAPKLFFRQYRNGSKMNQYVNGAEVLQTITASNGVVHVIDTFLHQVASTQNAYSYIHSAKKDRPLELRTSTFMEMLYEVQTMADSPHQALNDDTNHVTVFVPSDRALQSISRLQMERLKGNDFDLLKLVSRHIISSSVGAMNEGVKGVYHTPLLEIIRADEERRSGRLAEIPAMEGVIRPLKVGDELFVTNLCGIAKVLTPKQYNLRRISDSGVRVERQEVPVYPNITVNNGVVHIIDGLLGYIYNDAYEMIKEDKDISAMATFVRKATERWADRLRLDVGTVLTDDQKITVFVPINNAFYSVEQAQHTDNFKSNTTYIQQVLNMHIVRGSLSLTDMVNGSSIQTTRPGHVIKLTKLADNSIYLNLDHIRGRIVKPDVCVENGILHYVDTVLGVPYVSIFEEVYRNPALVTLYDVVRKVGLDSLLTSTVTRITFFAPNNHAFAKMKNTQVGKALLYPGSDNEKKLQQVLTAHTVRGYFYADEMTSDSQRLGNSELWLFRHNGGYYVERRAKFQVVRAKVIEIDLRMTNGVVFIINSTLYQDSSEAFDSIPVGGSQSCTPNVAALVVVILITGCLLRHC